MRPRLHVLHVRAQVVRFEPAGLVVRLEVHALGMDVAPTEPVGVRVHVEYRPGRAADECHRARDASVPARGRRHQGGERRHRQLLCRGVAAPAARVPQPAEQRRRRQRVRELGDGAFDRARRAQRATPQVEATVLELQAVCSARQHQRQRIGGVSAECR